MITLTVFVALIAVTNAFSDPDLNRNACELIESRKFVCETHYITTKDGYILTAHRIVNPYKSGRKLKVILIALRIGSLI